MKYPLLVLQFQPVNQRQDAGSINVILRHPPMVGDFFGFHWRRSYADWRHEAFKSDSDAETNASLPRTKMRHDQTRPFILPVPVLASLTPLLKPT